MYLTTNKTLARLTSREAVIESSLGRSVKLAAMVTMSKLGGQICPIILEMSGFNELKKNNVIWCSDHFYTHEMGYKMCIHIYPTGHGIGKDTHLSWYLFLVRGPHDDKLLWPLKEKIGIKLLNQISDNQHHSATVAYYKYDGVLDDFTGRVMEGSKAKMGRVKLNLFPLITSTRSLQHVSF